jgi:hypothetical protein
MDSMTVHVLAPRAEASNSARSIGGKDSSTSTTRSANRSNVPPRKALATPHTAPNVVPSSTDVTATNSDHLVPWRILLSTSLPMKSVPSQCPQLGPWARARTLGRRVVGRKTSEYAQQGDEHRRDSASGGKRVAAGEGPQPPEVAQGLPHDSLFKTDLDCQFVVLWELGCSSLSHASPCLVHDARVPQGTLSGEPSHGMLGWPVLVVSYSGV